MSMTHIETIELGSSAASITFSSIPQDYTDLVLLVSARTNRSSQADGIAVSFNGTGDANESRIQLISTGSAVSTLSVSNIRAGIATGSSATANTFSNNSVYISGYKASQAKSISVDTVSENNGTTAFQEIHAGLWNDTSAITSIALSADIGTQLETGTTASLYGITAGGSGTVGTA